MLQNKVCPLGDMSTYSFTPVVARRTRHTRSRVPVCQPPVIGGRPKIFIGARILEVIEGRDKLTRRNSGKPRSRNPLAIKTFSLPFAVEVSRFLEIRNCELGFLLPSVKWGIVNQKMILFSILFRFFCAPIPVPTPEIWPKKAKESKSRFLGNQNRLTSCFAAMQRFSRHFFAAQNAKQSMHRFINITWNKTAAYSLHLVSALSMYWVRVVWLHTVILVSHHPATI